MKVRTILPSFFFFGLVFAGLSFLNGCGGSDPTGTQVQVDEKQQADQQKATEEFYKQNSKKR